MENQIQYLHPQCLAQPGREDAQATHLQQQQQQQQPHPTSTPTAAAIHHPSPLETQPLGEAEPAP